MSFQLRFEVDQIQRFGRKLAEVTPRAIRQAIDEWTRKAGEALVRMGRAIVPVDTGYLSSRIEYIITGFGRLEFRASTHYAGYVEYGTRYMRAQPFMRPALRQLQGRFAQEIMPSILDAFSRSVRE